MTRFQVVNVYLKALEEEEEKKPTGTPVQNYQQLYQLVHQRKFGMDLDDIKAKWQADPSIPDDWDDSLVIRG